MANVFAIKSGNWNDNTVWDTNTPPTSADVIFTNGYTVTINTDVDVDQLRNGSNNGQLPNMCVPVMTSNTAPSGVASASNNNTTAFNAFNGIGWLPGVSTFTLTYKFPDAELKSIKKYRIVSTYNNAPKSWTLQASNDPTFATFVTIDTVLTSNNASICYISSILNNPNSYLYYRLNVTAIWFNPVIIYNFDMTESSAVTNGSGGTLATLIQTGGTYSVTTLPATPSTRTITVRNLTTGIQNTSVANTNSQVLQVSAPTGILNINHATLGNIVGGGALTAGNFNIYATGTAACTINVNGNLFGDTTSSGGSSRANAAFGIIGGITANITGTLTAGNMYFDGNAAFGSCAVYVGGGAGNAVVNVTGNLFGQSASLGGPGSDVIYLIGNNATLNITGNITANLFNGIRTWTTYTGNINVITGTVQASSQAMGIFNQGSGTVTLLSPVINTNNTMGVTSPRIRFYPTGISQWRFQNQTGANVTIYSGAGAGDGYPAVDVVRYGSPTYGPTLTEYNGTMRIPDVTNVNKGVEYGYGLVGTAVLTAEDFLNAISTSTNPMAIRLKNLSTTQTMGDQLSGFSNA